MSSEDDPRRLADTVAARPQARNTAPRHLGRYELVRELGRGGMGHVLLVRHPEWDLKLAVKAPFAGMEPELFEREAEAWMGLGVHPHVATCWFVQRIEEAPRLFAEYVAGGTLREWIDQGRAQDLARVLDLGIQIAWGLQHAHDHEVAHRDLKPSNVLMTEGGQARLTDFGLVGAEAAACTPQYAAPEQLEGKTVGPAADLFTWGLVFTELWIGEATWGLGPAGPEALEVWHSAPPEGHHTGEMPPELRRLVARCFTSPSRRPTARRIADRLRSLFETLVGRPHPRPRPNEAAARADALNNRAISSLELQPDQASARGAARGDLGAALELDPDHPRATFNLALLDWRAGLISEIQALERVRRVDEALARRLAVESGRPTEPICLARPTRLARALGVHEGKALIASSGAIIERPLSPSGEAGLGLPIPSAVEAVAAHEGAWVLGCRDGVLRAVIGAEVRDVPAHSGPIWALASGPKGLASAGRDGQVAVRNTLGGPPRLLFGAHAAGVRALAWGAPGLATGGSEGSVHLWNPGTGGQRSSWSPHRGGVSALAFAGSTLLSGGWDHHIALCPFRAQPRVLPVHHRAPVTALAAAGAAHHLHQYALSGDANGEVFMWALPEGRVLRRWQLPDAVLGLHLLEEAVIALDRGGSLHRWALPLHRARAPFLLSRPDPTEDVITRDAALRSALDEARSALRKKRGFDAAHSAVRAARRIAPLQPEALRLWRRLVAHRPGPVTGLHRLWRSPGPFSALACRRDRVLLGRRDGVAELRDGQGRILARFQADADGVCAAGFLGEQPVTAGLHGQVKIWSPAGAITHALGAPARSLVIHGERMWVGDASGAITCFESQGATRFQAHDGEVCALEVLEGELRSVGRDGTFARWRGATLLERRELGAAGLSMAGGRVGTLDGHLDQSAVSTHPIWGLDEAGDLLASVDGAGVLELWRGAESVGRVDTGAPLCGVAAEPDGLVVYTIGAEATAWFIDRQVARSPSLATG